MKFKSLLFLFSVLTLPACVEKFISDKIKGHAVIVDNFKDKTPLEGLYVEVLYTNDEGYTYKHLSSSTTDKNGYFEIDAKYRTGFFSIDSWATANVYSDKDCSDTLGSFGFQFADQKYNYSTIHLDTFSLEHTVWVKPRIDNLGNHQPDELSIRFYNCGLVDTSLTNMTYSDSLVNHQTFAPVEIKMTMGLQHWLVYGTKDLAIGSLKKNSKELGFGYFTLEDAKHTKGGDTLNLNFNVK